MEDGEEEVEDSVPSFAPNTQVETKGSDLTCRVSTHHATHHQIVIFYIELYSYLSFYCCIAEYEVEVEGEEQGAVEEEEVDDSVLPGLVLFPAQVETKGSNLTCRVSSHHATHHQIFILY